MFAYIESQRVYNVYDEIALYSEDFKLHCVEIPDGVTVQPGYFYIDGKFTAPPSIIIMPPSEDEINAIKAKKIAESKEKLAAWLETHPYKHTDGKYYACTAEKQSLLNGNLASCERAKAASIDYPLKWNSTGEECEPWEYSDLLVLSLSIAGYVAPRVSKQQEIELAIKACSTIEELNRIAINYETIE